MPRNVYCDEAGYTGENLLNPEQPFFSYASVCIEPDEAAEVATSLVRDFRLQGKELKGARLVQSERGRRAIARLLDSVGTRSQVVVHHKKFALAAKFFEYAFEPLISDINSLFYSVDFHKFVANVLYFKMFIGDERALDLAQRFEDAVRGDDSKLRDILSVHGPNERNPVEQLISFGIYNRASILRELDSVRRWGGWVLELTLTSLWSLLAYWGDRSDSLRVFCDPSVPLRAARDTINAMVGRSEKVTIDFAGKRRSLVFNLAEPIETPSSIDTPGIQLADVIATVACQASANPREPWNGAILERLHEAGAIHDDCVYPEIDKARPTTQRGAVNYMVLLELVRRSRDGESLMDGMGELIAAGYETFPEFQRRHLSFGDSSMEEA